MKVLAVSDIESPSLYDYFSPEKVEGVELIVGCGPLARHIVDGARAAGGETLYFADKAALLDALDGLIRPGDSVLVKASRSMAFEAIVERLTGQ